MPEEAQEPRPQATFRPDTKVKVTFSQKKYNRREPEDEPQDEEFHIVYMDLLDGTGSSDIGEAYPQESGDFDVELYVHRSMQPYAHQLVDAAVAFFRTKNVSVEYVD